MEDKIITRDEEVGIISCLFEGLGLTMVNFLDNTIWIGYGTWVRLYKEGRVVDTAPYWVSFRRIV